MAADVHNLGLVDRKHRWIYFRFHAVQLPACNEKSVFRNDLPHFQINGASFRLVFTEEHVAASVQVEVVAPVRLHVFSTLVFVSSHNLCTVGNLGSAVTLNAHAAALE